MNYEDLVTAGQAGAYIQREEIKNAIHQMIRAEKPADYIDILHIIRELAASVDLTIEKNTLEQTREFASE